MPPFHGHCPAYCAYAKANPGESNTATAGISSSVHLAGDLFMTITGVQLVPVHWRSSYVPDMLAGQLQVGVQSDTDDDRAGKGGQIARPLRYQ